jgi:error-prone DNA polymerase
VMQIAMVAAGFSGSEADHLRRSMAAWARRGGMEHMHQRLVGGMLERGYEESFAEQIFDQIKGFGEYGFPESHAASFALLVYISCWLKCHHPAAFTCALLNAQPMGFYPPSQLVQDARRHGVGVLPADIRFSDWDCSLTKGRGQPPMPCLRLGLRMVKGFGEAAAGRSVKAREQHPFRDVQDLADRASLNRREMAALAEAAALRGIAGHRHRARWEVASVAAQPDDLLHGTRINDEHTPIRPPDEADDLQADYASTGLTLGRHPLALLRKQLQHRRVKPASELSALPHGRPARACGLVTMRQRPATASGTIFLTLEDETGLVNVVVWPRLWKRQRSILLNATLLAVDGVLESDGDVCHLIAGRVHDFSELAKGLKTRSRDFC